MDGCSWTQNEYNCTVTKLSEIVTEQYNAAISVQQADGHAM